MLALLTPRCFNSKGIPNLFRDVRPLYADPAKVAAIQTLLEGYLTNLQAKNAFAAAEEKGQQRPVASRSRTRSPCS